MSTLATAESKAEPGAEAEAEADSEHFDTCGTLHTVLGYRGESWVRTGRSWCFSTSR